MCDAVIIVYHSEDKKGMFFYRIFFICLFFHMYCSTEKMVWYIMC